MPDKSEDANTEGSTANLSFSLEEVCGGGSVPVTYNELVRDVDLLEMTSDLQLDCHIAQEINYSTNFTRKDLDRIADYYSISKRKKLKDELIQEIILFETNPEKIEIVYRRKKLWSYMEEIKDDKYLRKFLIFN